MSYYISYYRDTKGRPVHQEDLYMLFKTYDLSSNTDTEKSRAFQPRMSNADKVFARAITKRQLFVIKDLMALDKTYPGLIDKDIIGGLYGLYTLLEDNVESFTLR